MKLINKTLNGQIMFCPGHQAYHLEFGNLFVHLTPDELNAFRAYVKKIDYKYYSKHNQKAQNRRKLLLHIGSQRINLALHAYEFEEILELLSLKKKNKTPENIEMNDYTVIYN